MINEVVNTGLVQQAVNTKSTQVSAIPTDKAVITQQAATTVQAEAQTAESDNKELNHAVSKLNDYVQNIRRTLSFSISESTGRTIIEVYDSETEELIRQIPPEQTVKLAENLADITDPGFFVKERA